MKKLLNCSLALALLCSGARGQAYGTLVPTYLAPFPIEVSDKLTTNLVFHYKIKNINVGSTDIVTLQANDTALQVWAAKAGFFPSNLSVFTSDGRLQAFSVSYALLPRQGNILFSYAGTDQALAAVNADIKTDDQLKRYCELSLVAPGIWHRTKDASGRVSALVKGVYIKENIFFIPVTFHNWSEINYDIRDWSFTLVDRKRAKRTATQNISITPVYSIGPVQKIPGHSKQTVVFAFSKFTILPKKVFVIGISEKDGGRNLTIVLGNSKLVRAEQLH